MSINLQVVLKIFKKVIWVEVLFLVLMSLFRLGFFYHFNPIKDLSSHWNDLINAFVLGARVDLTVIAYIQLPITLVLILFYYLRLSSVIRFIDKNVIYYLYFFFLLISVFSISDFGFYTYFKDHINLLYFGLFDDDTYALMQTFWENYPVVLLLAFTLLVFIIVFKLTRKILNYDYILKEHVLWLKNSILIFLLIFIVNLLLMRGSFSMYPLGRMIPMVGENPFINILAQNGTRAFITAYKIRNKFLSDKYDLIEATGFKDNIEEAFKILKQPKTIDAENLLGNITYKTTTKKIGDYNVVIIMVESFGMPILDYNTSTFNIMGELKKHFEEDTLFTNFISTGNGTVASLEAMILNLPNRVDSFPFAQSKYNQTQFKYAPAYVFAGQQYKTSFIYGGDLSWRDVGKFASYQGFDKTIGKVHIYNNIRDKKFEKDEYFHPWGIFDGYMYDYIFEQLKQTKQKHYILALSTNNHPPYRNPKGYDLKPLIITEDLDSHIISGRDLIQQRFESYQYALDSVGKFLTQVKSDPKLSKNTLVVVTADNNTIEGYIKYDKNELFTSKNIPFYLYIPEKLKQNLSINSKTFGSHKDIFPTVYNIVLSNTQYISVGTDMLDQTVPHIGENSDKIVVSKDGAIKVASLEKEQTSFAGNYYRALLAISEYLIDSYHDRKDKN